MKILSSGSQNVAFHTDTCQDPGRGSPKLDAFEIDSFGELVH